MLYLTSDLFRTPVLDAQVGDLPIHVAKKHFASDEVVDSLMPVTPEATGVEKSRDPNARENKIKNLCAR
jgi:hypothetical protein